MKKYKRVDRFHVTIDKSSSSSSSSSSSFLSLSTVHDKLKQSSSNDEVELFLTSEHFRHRILLLFSENEYIMCTSMKIIICQFKNLPRVFSHHFFMNHSTKFRMELINERFDSPIMFLKIITNSTSDEYHPYSYQSQTTSIKSSINNETMVH